MVAGSIGEGEPASSSPLPQQLYLAADINANILLGFSADFTVERW
jgi:hypothetical protein